MKEIIQPTLDINFLRLWNKNFQTVIYRNIQTFAFKVLQECNYWASRNSAQMFFFDTNQKHVFDSVAGVYFL